MLFSGSPQVLVDESNNDLDFISELSEDDPKLIKIIKNWFLESPPPPNVPYVFEQKSPNLNGQTGQPQVIDNLLNQVTFANYVFTILHFKKSHYYLTSVVRGSKIKILVVQKALVISPPLVISILGMCKHRAKPEKDISYPLLVRYSLIFGKKC